MKKVTYFIILFFGVSAFTNIQAQYYHFSQSNKPYAPISNPSYIVTDSAIINQYSLLLQSTYSATTPVRAFGEDVSNKTIFAGRNGFLNTSSNNSGIVFDPFFYSLRSNGQSEFRAQETLVGQDSVLEVEWHNFNIVNHPLSDFITFKAIFYIRKEIVEFHYGPSNVTIPFANNANIGALKANTSFSTVKELMFLSGSPSSPTVNTTQINPIDSFPQNGTVYTFTAQNIITGISEIDFNKTERVFRPNPAKNFLLIDNPQEIKTIKVLSITGQEVNQWQSPLLTNKLPLNSISEGIYVLLFTFNNNEIVKQKLVIAR